MRTHLGDELDDFDEDVERRLSRNDRLAAFGKERIDNALEAGLGRGVAFAFDSNHVHPQQSIQRLEGDAAHFRVAMLQMGQAHREKAVPILEKERLLRHAQQTRHEGEQRERVFLFRAQVQRLRVQRVDKVFQARHVHFVLHRRRDGHEDFDEEAGQRVFDVFVLHFEKVDGAFAHKLERRFELFDRRHFDAEKLHSHQQ